MKSIISSIVLFLLFTPLYAQNKETVSRSIDNILADEFFNSTLAAVTVYDLTAKENIYNKNEKMLLHPASNMKVLTTAAALMFLGPGYTFKTYLYRTGEVVNGTLLGDLYVVGGMNPDFTSSDFDKLIDTLKAAGIKEISGSIIGDVSVMDSVYWGQGWMWDDDPSTDAPYLTALNINDNAVTITVSAGEDNTPALIKIDPPSSYFELENKTITAGGILEDDLFINRDWVNRTNKLTVSGIKYTGTPEVTERINVYNPKLYFLTLFKEKLLANGIDVKGSLLFNSIPSHSEPVAFNEIRYDSVIINLNKTSDNLSAEMTLRAMGLSVYGPPANAEKGLRLIDSLVNLSGLNASEYRFVDGSGVSHYNLVSSELMTAVLKYMYYIHPALYGILYSSMPVAGVDGSLRNRMKETRAANNVHAKTGTLSGVSTLSGYVTAANGNILAFSILMQNHVNNTDRAVYFQNEICRILAEYNPQSSLGSSN